MTDDVIDIETNGQISLKDEIAAAFDAQEEQNPLVGPDEAQEEDSSLPPADAVEEDDPEDSPPPPLQADEEGEPEEDEPEERTTNYDQPPEHWAQDQKDKFNAIPEEHREIVMDARKSLERGYQTKFEGIASIQKEHDQIVDMFKPVEAMLAANNMDRVGGIRTLFQVQQQLQNDPVSALTNLIGQHGENATNILQSVAQNMGVQINGPEMEVDDYMDPQVKQIRDELAAMKQQNLAQQQIAQQQQTADLTTQIQMFAETKNSDGSLKYPHFETIKPKMGQLMQAGLSSNLEEAYNAAVGIDPELSAQRDKTRDAATAAKSETARKKSVKKAKASSRDVSTRRAPPVPSKGNSSVSIMDSVTAAFDAQNG